MYGTRLLSFSIFKKKKKMIVSSIDAFNFPMIKKNWNPTMHTFIHSPRTVKRLANFSLFLFDISQRQTPGDKIGHLKFPILAICSSIFMFQLEHSSLQSDNSSHVFDPIHYRVNIMIFHNFVKVIVCALLIEYIPKCPTRNKNVGFKLISTFPIC